MKQVIYADKITGETILLAEVTSNHSMAVWEALEIAGINMDEYAAANGWDGWDPEAIEFAEPKARQMTIKTATAKALSDAKAKRNLTLADIGARMEISPQAVGEYMRGDKHPSVSMFAKFCKAMGAEPAEVLAEIMSTAEDEEMKEFAIVTEKGIDIWVDRFETEEEAVQTAKWEWDNRLTAADKRTRKVTVGRLANPKDEDGFDLDEVSLIL